MSEPRPEPERPLPPEPGEQPPPAARRRLERSPSSRYEPRSSTAGDAAAERGWIRRRWLIAGVGFLVGIGGTLLLVVGLSTTTGLIFVAGASGLMVGSQLVARSAVALTLAGLFGGVVGAWFIGRAEGGDLDLAAYAWEIFGLGLIGQVLVGALAAAYASASIRSGR